MDSDFSGDGDIPFLVGHIGEFLLEFSKLLLHVYLCGSQHLIQKYLGSSEATHRLESAQASVCGSSDAVEGHSLL